MKFFTLLLISVILLVQVSVAREKPNLFLLNRYSKDMNVSGWFMSEKLDGVRAYWDGKHLISRSGKHFAVPKFFIKDFPTSKLDGELWSKRGDFENIASIANSKDRGKRWEQLTYNIYEVPDAEGNLTTRLATVKESKYVRVLQQKQIHDAKELDAFLKSVEKKGGEGVVVRDGSLKYYTGRNNNALKVKSYRDEECKVVGYNQGSGKNSKILGSLLCKMQNGKVIKIGSGFTHKERVNPPEIGSTITFKYYGLTNKGNPRFPIFMRIRVPNIAK